MKTGKLVIAIFFLAGWNSLFAQKNEDYRLQALMFFCQNKNDIFRLDNFEFGSIEPLFVLDLNVNENDTDEQNDAVENEKKQDVVISENNSEENLQLLCPNCHAMTENFGSRNKKSTRTYRIK